MLLANGQTEQPGKESATSYNAGLSRVTAQGDGAPGRCWRTETPNFSLLCMRPAGEFGCAAGWGNRCRARGGEGVMLLRWVNLSSEVGEPRHSQRSARGCLEGCCRL